MTGGENEAADDYGQVVVQANPAIRVIACRSGLQWIVQQGKISGPGVRWRGKAYCRTRAGLIDAYARLNRQVEPEAVKALEALPLLCGKFREGRP